MKKIVLKLSAFSIICIGILSFVLIKYGGNIDYFYNKFTSPKANSLVIGDSRSMQGIQPAQINTTLKDAGFELPILNYSFTIAQAPIGPLYTESILKKIDKSTSNGIFIISLTPWMFGSDKNLDNTKNEFREDNAPPHNMMFVNVNPNFEYVFKNLSYFHFKSVFRKKSTMHKDGWLEESNIPTDPETFKVWKGIQLKLFNKMKDDYQVSKLRLASLDILIKKLKKYGSVYLVRMPITDEFLQIETGFYPTFNKDIQSVALKNEISYLNYATKELSTYKTYDGHHLDKNSGKDFTINLSTTILKNTKNTHN